MLDGQALALHPPRLNARLVAQSEDAMLAAGNAPFVERAPSLDPTIDLPVIQVHAPDVDQQLLISHATGAGRPMEPGVKPAARDRQLPAQLRHRELAAMRTDEAVLHEDSFAKYAAAFFKISRSSVTRFNSRRSCSTSVSSDSRFAPGPRNACCAPLLRNCDCHL